jgi:serine/threonine protein phosphatase PrpC
MRKYATIVGGGVFALGGVMKFANA